MRKENVSAFSKALPFDCKGNQSSFFLLENKQLYCHYKQEETLQEMYHKNLKYM